MPFFFKWINKEIVPNKLEWKEQLLSLACIVSGLFMVFEGVLLCNLLDLMLFAIYACFQNNSMTSSNTGESPNLRAIWMRLVMFTCMLKAQLGCFIWVQLFLSLLLCCWWWHHNLWVSHPLLRTGFHLQKENNNNYYCLTKLYHVCAVIIYAYSVWGISIESV